MNFTTAFGIDSNDDRLYLSRLRENIAVFEMHGVMSLGDSSRRICILESATWERIC